MNDIKFVIVFSISNSIQKYIDKFSQPWNVHAKLTNQTEPAYLLLDCLRCIWISTSFPTRGNTPRGVTDILLAPF